MCVNLFWKDNESRLWHLSPVYLYFVQILDLSGHSTSVLARVFIKRKTVFNMKSHHWRCQKKLSLILFSLKHPLRQELENRYFIWVWGKWDRVHGNKSRYVNKWGNMADNRDSGLLQAFWKAIKGRIIEFSTDGHLQVMGIRASDAYWGLWTK